MEVSLLPAPPRGVRRSVSRRGPAEAEEPVPLLAVIADPVR
ncbi:hypothetical protein ABZU75_18075 [Streptosporangium sp. NPDC005286]